MRLLSARSLERNGTLVARQFTVAIVAGMLTGAAIGAGPVVVSQRGRQFQPQEVAIKRGETLQFINDDGDLLHHTYLKSDSFSFDSGDQKPGSKFEVAFTVTGKFAVLCAIHPKMKLLVLVD
jgi:plastocyanin